MKDESSFLRFAAVCSAVSALTTFLLWLLPRFSPDATSFETTLDLARNFPYMARWWVNFAHIFFALTAYLGAALVLRYRSVGWAVWGFLQFAIWGVTELLGVTVAIWAVNRGWRTEFAAADQTRQAVLRVLLEGWPDVWNGMFFLLLIAFLFGSLSMGTLAFRGSGLERATGVLLLLSVPLSVLIILAEYFSVSIAGSLESVIYPILQPVSRFTMAVWLWRSTSAKHSRSELDSPSPSK